MNSIAARHQVPLRNDDGAHKPASCEYCGAPTDSHGDYSEPVGTENQREFVRGMAAICERDVVDGMIMLLRVCNGCSNAEIAERLSDICEQKYTEDAIRKRCASMGKRFPCVKKELNPGPSWAARGNL